jgi:hypothetical protein
MQVITQKEDHKENKQAIILTGSLSTISWVILQKELVEVK